jgi:hypothetical protein
LKHSQQLFAASLIGEIIHEFFPGLDRFEFIPHFSCAAILP